MFPVKNKAFLLLSALLLITAETFAQKAFEAIYYHGKAQNITVRLLLADGYISGSEIKTTDNRTHKTAVFTPDIGVPDEQKQIRFTHFSRTGKAFTDYFILQGMEEVYATPPVSINGRYYFNGRDYEVVLKRR